MATTTKGFTKKFTTFTFAKDKFKVEHEEIHSIKLSNIHLDRVRGRIACGLHHADESQVIVNGKRVSHLPGSSSTSYYDITTAFDSPNAFLEAFHINPIDKTKVQIQISVDSLAANAPQAVREFFNNKFTPANLQDFLSNVKQEISSRRKNTKLEGELKDNLLFNVLKYANKNSDKPTYSIFIRYALMACLMISMLGASTLIAAALNMSAMLVAGSALFGLIAVVFYAQKVISDINKQEVEQIKELGVLKGENINTPTSKKKLVNRLSNLLILPECVCNESLEIGINAYHNTFNQFKSFFSKSAYSPAYYVGQEMAANRRLK